MNGLSVSMESGTLSMENLEVIRRLSGVETAMPLMIEYSTSLLGSVSDSTLICGIDSGARQVISLRLRHGRLITTGDVRSSARVCMLDETVAQAAFGRSNIVGKTIELAVGGSTEAFTIGRCHRNRQQPAAEHRGIHPRYGVYPLHHPSGSHRPG